MSPVLVPLSVTSGALPEFAPFDELRLAVLNGVSARNSKRNYALALDELSDLCKERARPLSRALLLEFRAALVVRGLSPSSVNVKLSAARKLVDEAKRAGVVSADAAAEMTEVPNVREQGTRLGKSPCRSGSSRGSTPGSRPRRPAS